MVRQLRDGVVNMINLFDDSEVKNSLTSRVFRQVEREILDGTLAPGSALTEMKLSQQLGVSRTPVREALFQLEQEGLVNIIPNKGAVVVGITKKDIEDIYTIRMQIEGLASKWAAERITPQETKRLKEIVELEMFYAKRGDILQSRNLDTTFHSALYDASGSKPLKNTLKAFHNYIGKARETSFGSGGRALISAIEHMRILEAIQKGDGGLAESLTNQHIKNAKANLLDSMKNADQNAVKGKNL